MSPAKIRVSVYNQDRKVQGMKNGARDQSRI